MRKPALFIWALVATLAIGQQTNADIVIDIIESGGNLEATLSGDFNLNATQGFAGSVKSAWIGSSHSAT